MAKRSNNSYYQSPDLTNITNNLSKIMGMSGNADSNYLTNLGKVQRLEGLQFDNNKKFNLQKALDAATGVKGMSADNILTRRLANSSGDLGLGIKRESLLPGQLKLQGLDIGQEGRKLDTANMVNNLQKMIMGNKKNDPRTFETGDAWLKERATNEDQLSSESFEDAATKLIAIMGGQRKINSDLSGERGARKSDDASSLKQSEIRYKDEQTKAVVAESKKREEKLTNEIAKIADEILLKSKLNAAQVMEIKNRVLNAVAKLDQNNLTAAERRKLIKEQTNVQAQKVLEETAKAGIAGNNKLISDAELKANPGKLTNEKKQRTVKLADLQAKLAREGDAGKREKIKREIAEQTKQPKINTAVDKAENQRGINKNTVDKGRLTNAKIFQTLINTLSPNDLTQKRALKAAQINKANGTTGITTGTTTPDSSGRMLTNDGAFADLESETPNIVMPGLQGVESILKALGIGGSATAPVARSANAPASSPAQIAPQILSSLQGQNTAGWNANQVKAFIQKVVAQSNGAVTPEQAMQILEMSKKGN